MVVVDIVVAASAALVFGVVVLTAKFSREVPINKSFDELWFENISEARPELQQSAIIEAESIEEKIENSALNKVA